jgi:hypothetical protein
VREANDSAALDALLENQHKIYENNCFPADINEHVMQLELEFPVFEARKCLAELQKIPEANGPDKENFSVRMDNTALNNFNSFQMNKFLEALPFDNPEIEIKSGNVSAFMKLNIPRNEVLKERGEVKTEKKPSITAQLKLETGKSETKSGFRKSKNMEIEGS